MDLAEEGMMRMDDRQRWFAFVGGEADEKEMDKLLSEASAELDELLESRPSATDDVIQTLGRRLDGGIHETSWELVETGLMAYLGLGPAFLVRWIVLAEADDPDRLVEFAKRASPKATAAMRAIVGSYGPELRDAYIAWQQFPHDWRSFYRDVFQDAILQTPFIRIRLTKYNGEEVLLEGSPTSLLALARNLVLTLQLAGSPEAFSQEVVAGFADETDKLMALIAPDNNKEP